MDVEDEIAMVAMLSASFALVKPAGMTPKETKDWIRVALDALSHLPYSVFENGCRAARLTCTHHSQIVPAIVTATRDGLALYNRRREGPLLHLVPPTRTITNQPLPDPETLMPSLKRIGLLKGFILEEKGGRLVWAGGDADNARARPG